jgi:spore maturation protein CgeB
MNVVYFTHSLASCWNHGNAHFLRGVLRELIHAGHRVKVYEPEDAWSLTNLLESQGEAGLAAYRSAYPELSSSTFAADDPLDPLVAGADAVIVHEWNEPALVAALGRLRRRGRFTLLFHDTHHRAVSDPEAMRRFDLSAYDGVLAFGEALAEVYRRAGWGRRVFVWHEAADTRLFHPTHADDGERNGLVWIGNWGDEERSAELETFLLKPAAAARLPLDIHGVRYPDAALALLARHGARYRGWIANAAVPPVFARHLATVHVPRRFYVDRLPGIPTIRVFEALACGIPLVCSPWRDSEELFRPGIDLLVARDGGEMAQHLTALKHDADLRREIAESGLASVLARHTCRHRMEELLGIVAEIAAGERLERVA